MSLAKGPFDIEWRGSILNGIEALDVTYDVNSNDYDSLQGASYRVYGAHRVSLETTFLETDIDSLAEVLPQYWKAHGSTLSNGQTVNDASGAIDLVPGGCDAAQFVGDLNVTSCGNPGQVAKFRDVTTEFAGIEFEANGIRKIRVSFTGVPVQGEATLILYKEGALTGVS